METDRGKTVTKPLALSRLGLPLSEKQIPQVVENLENGDKPKEALEWAAMRPRQVRYQAALRPDSESTRLSIITRHYWPRWTGSRRPQKALLITKP